MINIVNELPLAYRVQTHNSCGCNELKALVKRHLVDRHIRFDREFFRFHAKRFVRRFNGVWFERAPFHEIIAGYDGAKKRRYKTAREQIKLGSRERAWASVQMFVKPDRYSEEDVYQKDPRAIQYRHPCFNLLMATYLKRFEHWYYQFEDEYGAVVAKGKNNLDRAANIVDASKHFENPIFVLTDHSRFDSCVRVEHLKMCHRIYKNAVDDSGMTRLLAYQIHNRGFSKSGIRYKVTGTRMSGDFDTGLGNSIINHMVLTTVFRKVKHHLLLDGDDSVLIMEKRDYGRVDMADFERLGFNTKVEVVERLSDVEFCRAKLLNLDPPRFARDPVRALSNMTVSFKTYPNAGVARYLAGLGVGEASASNGVPIIGPIAAKMASISDRPILDENIKYMYGAAGDPLAISDDARMLFEEAYGWTPAVQKIVEDSYRPEFWVGHRSKSLYYANLPLGPSSIFPY
ncbi:RNA-dependent RNA polymerase [Erysiphe necator associated tombus-like virus 1]|nr:RNA-dependent RNA polymerase [Erysiphe necator associated tombus-like virus 1]